ncbi:MAG: hypothetical protein WA485_03840 [Candidatus Sulfotelmatobacter sp.]
MGNSVAQDRERRREHFVLVVEAWYQGWGVATNMSALKNYGIRGL